jgi:amino acid transporter
MQSITTVAPAIGMFFTIQFIASYAGIVAPLGYLLAFLIVLMLAASVSQLAKHLPNAGGYYTYISHTLHPRLGWLSGWIMFLYMPVAPFTSPVFLSFLLRDELKTSSLGWDIPWWILFLALEGLVVLLMYRGIQVSGQALLIAGLAEIVIVFGLSVWGFFDSGPGGLNLSSYNPGNTTSHDLFFAVVFSIFALTGWEAAAPIAEETEDPKRNVPRALIYSVIFMGAFFAICSWGLVIGWGTKDVSGLVGSSELIPFTLAKQFWGPLWWLAMLALINSAFAVSIATMNASTRMWFAMARSGSLPKALRKVHPTLRTPVNALLLQAAITFGFGLVLGARWGGATLFFISGLLFTLCASWIYILGNVGVMRYYLTERRPDLNPILHLLFPVVSSIVLVYVCIQTFTNPTPTGRLAYALPIFIVWLVVGIAVLVAMRMRGSEEWLLRAGQAVHEHTETPDERGHHATGV